MLQPRQSQQSRPRKTSTKRTAYTDKCTLEIRDDFTGVRRSVRNDMKPIEEIYNYIIKTTLSDRKLGFFVLALKDEKLSEICDASLNSIETIETSLYDKVKDLTVEQYENSKNDRYKQYLRTCASKATMDEHEWEYKQHELEREVYDLNDNVNNMHKSKDIRHVTYNTQKKKVEKIFGSDGDTKGYMGIRIKFLNLFNDMKQLNINHEWFDFEDIQQHNIRSDYKEVADKMIEKFFDCLQENITMVEREMEKAINMCGAKKEDVSLKIANLIQQHLNEYI